MPEDVIDLINNILIEDINKRFDIKQIKNHKYFKDINWDTLLTNKVPIDLEKLEELNKISIEKNNNQNFWEQFINDINNNNNENNFLESDNDFEVEKLDELPIKIKNDFFYSKELVDKKKNSLFISGIVKKCGLIVREVKIKVSSVYKKLEVFDLEKNDFIKKYDLNNKIKVKIENENEFSVDGDRYRTSAKEVEKWNNSIIMIINS